MAHEWHELCPIMIYSDIYSLYSDMIQDMMFVGLEALVLQSRVFLIFYLSSSLLSSPKRVLFEKKNFQRFHRNFLLSEFSDIFFVNSHLFFPKKMSTFKKRPRDAVGLQEACEGQAQRVFLTARTNGNCNKFYNMASNPYSSTQFYCL